MQQSPKLHAQLSCPALVQDAGEICCLQAITVGAIGVAAVADLYDRNTDAVCVPWPSAGFAQALPTSCLRTNNGKALSLQDWPCV